MTASRPRSDLVPLREIIAEIFSDLGLNLPSPHGRVRTEGQRELEAIEHRHRKLARRLEKLDAKVSA